MNRLEQFAEAVREGCAGRKRASLDEHIWPSFQIVYGQMPDGRHPRPVLREVLDELRSLDVWAFPKGKKLFNNDATPPLPNWVEFVSSEEEALDSSFDHRIYPWHPDLAWVAGLRVLHDHMYLIEIDKFLKGPGRSAALVPHRERSLQIFGDEKALDRLSGRSWFGDRRVTFEILRCQRAAPPFVHRGLPAGVPARHQEILVIENHHTWHSFAQWNEFSRMYIGVVYGCGNQFAASVSGIQDLADTLGASSISYFGDLDHEGVAIPARADKWQRVRGLLPISPAELWYEALLRLGAGHKHPIDAKKKLDLQAVEWLPEHLQTSVRAMLESGHRLPQEYVGTEFLTNWSRPDQQ